LNTIFERSKDHLIAFVAIAFISILSRRLKRLVAKDLSARPLQTASESGTASLWTIAASGHRMCR
jgi:hypothetical protein